MLYKITKQYLRGTPMQIAQFNEMNDAKLFVREKLAEDARLKVKVIYRLLEGMEMIEEFSEAQPDNSSSGSSAGARSSFQPTPFSAAPRPPGTPPNWLKDEEGKEGGKK